MVPVARKSSSVVNSCQYQTGNNKNSSNKNNLTNRNIESDLIFLFVDFDGCFFFFGSCLSKFFAHAETAISAISISVSSGIISQMRTASSLNRLLLVGKL